MKTKLNSRITARPALLPRPLVNSTKRSWAAAVLLQNNSRVDIIHYRIMKAQSKSWSRRLPEQQRYPKRHIEVDLPMREVSKQSAREKSIRHDRISTFHIWCARRPLTACFRLGCQTHFYQRQVMTLVQIRDTLLHKLISGGVRVQDVDKTVVGAA